MKPYKILSLLVLLLGLVPRTSPAQNAVSIDPRTGTISINATSSASGPSVTLSASPSSVVANGTTTVSWVATDFGNNLSCIRSSNPALSSWSGSSSLASGSTSITMPATSQSVTLTLSCSGANGSNSNFTNVTVGGAVDCSSRPPGVLGSPRKVVNQTFTSIWNTDFPGIFGSAYGSQVPGISDGSVLAFSFVAPLNNVVEGYLQAVYSPESGGRGSLASAFSECPGVIDNSTPTCEPSFGKVRNEWTTTGRANACNLIPGRTYYFNLSIQNECVFGPDPGQAGGICSFRLESRRYFQKN